jgi:hypothetical protein
VAAAPTDLACVVHVHSTYSDGTGTVSEIAAAAARAGVDVVLLTDHDTLGAKRDGEERWHGSVLVCVGVEVTPRDENHFLAFGLDEPVRKRGLDARGVVAAVSAAGGFGFLAHPFARGSERFRRARGFPWRDFDVEGYTGIELWSLVTDYGVQARSLRDVVRFVLAPARAIVAPPEDNLRQWDLLTQRRRVVAIGGVDAHQFGVRVGNRVPLRLMAYHRSFAHLRTHVLLDEPPGGDAAADRDAVYAALRAGRCYLAVDSLAPARGFRFFADRAKMGDEVALDGGLELHARLPRAASITLVRDGERIESVQGAELDHAVRSPGVYRVEASLERHGRVRTWVISNPIYAR